MLLSSFFGSYISIEEPGVYEGLEVEARRATMLVGCHIHRQVEHPICTLTSLLAQREGWRSILPGSRVAMASGNGDSGENSMSATRHPNLSRRC